MKKNSRKELEEIYGITDVIDIPPTATSRVEPKAEVIVQPAAPSINSWEELEKALPACIACRLHETRQNVVFGEGNRSAELMFIGEGPGAEEDKTGQPFVGRAGKLLTKMIEAMGYTREDVFIANVVKCRPPENREPFKDEVAACISYLKAQIALINPKVIVCLGSTSAEHLLQTGKKISTIRGKFQDYGTVKVMPTYHPAYLLRNESKKKDVWIDLQEVMKILGKK